ncbi:hypothetical protein CTAYLR_005085 [Chrysophaeum taylorii]|uniref:Ketoreductase domain-containing protein n=1 Tax=Chrysophaeum taylorii TaxID=2483200 RepID=A0AAD7UC48_9STRA|nr:hypothetical protein CTAYLR_005085 [Chrysophaeum taylorii]
MLAGKTAIITGASGGIGASVARVFASNGCRVILTGRRGEALEKVRRSIEADNADGAVDCHAGDVTNAADVKALFETAVRKYERVDILVNNAGITASGGVEIDVDTFRRVLDVNVVGAFLCAQAAFRHRVPRIINVGSISSMAPRPDATAYTTSKYAIDGLTRSLALDGRPLGIAVGVVHPGNVSSDLLSPAEVEDRRRTEGLLDAENVARSVLLMATMPPEANVLELCVMPTQQPLVGRG